MNPRDPDYFARLDAAGRAAAARFGTAEHIASARQLVAQLAPIVALTGAGVSTESGIPDFRSPGGVWSGGAPPAWSQERYVADAGQRRERFARLLATSGARPQPNAAHASLVALEAAGRLGTVITQNVDGLHQAAGSQRVVELHGSVGRWQCLDCSAPEPADTLLDRLRRGDDDPHCRACGGVLRPGIVGFGESLPTAAWQSAVAALQQAALLLVIGTSLTVRPAADLPLVSLERGTPIIVIGIAETPLDDRATVRLWGKAGELLPAIASPEPAPAY